MTEIPPTPQPLTADERMQLMEHAKRVINVAAEMKPTSLGDQALVYAWRRIACYESTVVALEKEREELRAERDAMVIVAKDAHAAWDADQDSRVGKLLAALCGKRGIRIELDDIRASSAPDGDTWPMSTREELRAEAEHWRRLAERIAGNVERNVFCLGLCGELRDCEDWDEMDRRVKHHLNGALYIEAVGDSVNDDGNDYNLPLLDQAKIRVLACLFLALECEDEARR